MILITLHDFDVWVSVHFSDSSFMTASCSRLREKSTEEVEMKLESNNEQNFSIAFKLPVCML